jgi:hypothetical protein
MVLRNKVISFGHKQTLNMVANPLIRMLPLKLNGVSWGTYTILKKEVSLSSSTQLLINYLTLIQTGDETNY